MGPLLFFQEASSFFLNLSPCRVKVICQGKFLPNQILTEKKDQTASSSLQKIDSDVKKFGFKIITLLQNAPLVPGFGLERWSGRKTKTKGEVPCLMLP